MAGQAFVDIIMSLLPPPLSPLFPRLFIFAGFLARLRKKIGFPRKAIRHQLFFFFLPCQRTQISALTCVPTRATHPSKKSTFSSIKDSTAAEPTSAYNGKKWREYWKSLCRK
jgi:hypothetical protein